MCILYVMSPRDPHGEETIREIVQFIDRLPITERRAMDEFIYTLVVGEV